MHAGYNGGGMGSLDGLSRRRELVELLDSEPVFAYLLQNGVLDQQHVDDIKKEASPAKVIIGKIIVEHTKEKNCINIISGIGICTPHIISGMEVTIR